MAYNTCAWGSEQSFLGSPFNDETTFRLKIKSSSLATSVWNENKVYWHKKVFGSAKRLRKHYGKACCMQAVGNCF